MTNREVIERFLNGKVGGDKVKVFNGTGNEIEWEIVVDKFKRCIDCEIYIKNETRNLKGKAKKQWIEEYYDLDSCQNHTHLYQQKCAKLWHDSNNNYVYGENIPNDWLRLWN